MLNLSTEWLVPVTTILARLDSMDPGAASADAAEIGRILAAVKAVADRLDWVFGDSGGVGGGSGAGTTTLAGAGAAAAEASGRSLAGRLTAAAAQLAPVQQALAGAAGDLSRSQSLRPQVAMIDPAPALGSTDGLHAAQLAAVAETLTTLYNGPMSGHADGIAVETTASGPGTADPAAGPRTAGTLTTGDPVSQSAGTGTGDTPAPAGVVAMPDGAATAPAVRTTAPGASAPDPAPSAPWSAAAPGRAGPTAASPGAGPDDDPPAGPAATVVGRTDPSPRDPDPGDRRVGGLHGVDPLAPAATLLPAAPMPGPGGAAGPAAAVRAAGATPSVPSVPGGAAGSSPTSPAGRGGPASGYPAGGGRPGAQEDRRHRRPAYLLSAGEGVGLLGTLPVAGPAVLGVWPDAGDGDAADGENGAADDGPEYADGEADGPVQDDQDRDFTL